MELPTLEQKIHMQLSYAKAIYESTLLKIESSEFNDEELLLYMKKVFACQNMVEMRLTELIKQSQEPKSVCF